MGKRAVTNSGRLKCFYRKLLHRRATPDVPRSCHLSPADCTVAYPWGSGTCGAAAERHVALGQCHGLFYGPDDCNAGATAVLSPNIWYGGIKLYLTLVGDRPDGMDIYQCYFAYRDCGGDDQAANKSQRAGRLAILPVGYLKHAGLERDAGIA